MLSPSRGGWLPAPTFDGSSEFQRRMPIVVTSMMTPAALELMRVPRMVFVGLASVSLASTLNWGVQAWWQWTALAIYATAWPPLAHWAAKRSRNPERAERRNLVLDGALAGGWIAVTGGSLLPGALLTAIVGMNALALGGRRMLLRSLEAELCAAAVLWIVLVPKWDIQPQLTTLLASLPLLVAYPLLFAGLCRRLAIDFNRQHGEYVRSEQLYRETFDAMEAGIVLFDEKDRLVLCNDDFRKLYPEVGMRFAPGQTFREMLEMAVAAGVIRAAKGSGTEWIEQRVAAHLRPSGPVIRQMSNGSWRRILEQRLPGGGILAFSIDVTELVASRQALAGANAELERLSETDGLTGLSNRRHFDRRLQEECLRASRYRLPLALLLLDADYFKRINDFDGHLAGDHSLRMIAQALSKCTVRSADLVSRFGGEEFAVLLPHTTTEEAIEVARRCLAAVDMAGIPHPDSPLGSTVTVSIGVAAVQSAGAELTPSYLIDMADRALYRAKRMGRHQIQHEYLAGTSNIISDRGEPH